jgi:hypothetical protein
VHSEASLAPRCPFDDPIPVPKKNPLLTLKNAAAHSLKLPKNVSAADHWQIATEQLIDAAEGRNWHCAAVQPTPRTYPPFQATEAPRGLNPAARWNFSDSLHEKAIAFSPTNWEFPPTNWVSDFSSFRGASL